MRTTLDLDEDVMHAAKSLAQQRGQTAGQVISDLVRIALKPRTAPRVRNGVRLFTPKPGAKIPSLALVNKLRDSD
ncbi:MAG TPA: hypothetical protein VEU96_20130 [Bryobacteraceae bacterium]|nr:hypothetical protein [Bryobacteraceae bacterium]